MEFKDWLKSIEEVTTSTADIAHFARPVGPMHTRMFPEPIMADEDEKRKIRKEKRQVHTKDM